MLTSPAIDVSRPDQPSHPNPAAPKRPESAELRPQLAALSDTDIELAAWLAGAARNHPLVEHVTAPLSWPAAARAKLEQLISDHRDMDRPGGLPPRPRGLELRVAAEIHELCAAHGAGSDLADAIILDDDREWQRRYLPESARSTTQIPGLDAARAGKEPEFAIVARQLLGLVSTAMVRLATLAKSNPAEAKRLAEFVLAPESARKVR